MRVQDRRRGVGRYGTGAGLVRGTEGGLVGKSGPGIVVTSRDPANDTTIRDPDRVRESLLGSGHGGANRAEPATKAGLLMFLIDAALGPHRPFAKVTSIMTTTAAA